MWLCSHGLGRLSKARYNAIDLCRAPYHPERPSPIRAFRIHRTDPTFSGSAVSRQRGGRIPHCAAGHVFLVVSENFKWEEPQPEGPGHTILV